MSHALVTNGVPAEILGGDFVTPDGTQYPRYVLDIWPEHDLNRIGVYSITEPTVPPGKQIASTSLSFDGVTVVRTATFSDAPVVIPQSVTAVKGRIVLLNAGKLDAVIAAVNAADRATQLWFEYATIWERDNSILNTLASQLGLSASDVDAMFIQAA